MTKIDIFSGFLGAGKTTLIKKLIAEAYSGEKLVLIENEFGEINIDGGFLKESGIEISEMSAGCICCSLVGDFNKALKEVVAQFHPDRILIEPSGVGKLSDVIVAVQRTVDECPELKLNSYVTVADASKVKVYMKNFGEFYNNQIEAAGTIILSRTQKMTQEKLEAAVSMLREKNADAAIKIAVLEFSSGTRWITPAPMDAEDFTWSFLTADGLTDFGAACKQLNEKLSRKAFMSDVAGSFAPAIFLLSDGEPTDEYSSELSKLMENNWFKKAIKVAVAIGEDANKAVLAEFTGNKEAVLTVHTPEALTKMIRFVSVTASQIGSKSSGVGKGGVDEAANKQDEMIDKINEVKAAEPDDDGDLEW